MNQQERDRITYNTEAIANILNADRIIDSLYQEKVLSRSEYKELIEAEVFTATEHENRTKRLLILLKNSTSRNSFVIFCQALKDIGHVDLLELINPTPSTLSSQTETDFRYSLQLSPCVDIIFCTALNTEAWHGALLSGHQWR